MQLGDRGRSSDPTSSAVPERTLPVTGRTGAKDPLLFIEHLQRVFGRIAAGDFSEKPAVPEGHDGQALHLASFRQIAQTLETTNAEARDAIEQLIERDRTRSRFASMVGHDLMGLLGVMNIHLQVVENTGCLGPAARDVLSPVHRALERAKRLVSNLRHLSQVDDDSFELDRRPFDLAAELDRAVADFRPQVAANGIRVQVRSPPSLAAAADAPFVHQVLHNLLSNAGKATASGGAIEVAAKETSDAIQVSVSDTGIGIPPEEVMNVFHPYKRLSTTTPGTGLGLYISKRIVEAHGGRIWCESQGLGRGTTFHFTLPAAPIDLTAVSGQLEEEVRGAET